ncbi:MAG: helix-turn-helix domain-containing protein [Candidatus Omnitrophica bacterium]|nr:helix-turn-helix domain-containing protein [Candidatus Omnitrophota bacterium]
MDRLLTITDLCQRYTKSKWTIYQWTAKNLIPHLHIMGQLRFRTKDLEQWEEQGFSGATKNGLL